MQTSPKQFQLEQGVSLALSLLPRPQWLLGICSSGFAKCADRPIKKVAKESVSEIFQLFG